MVASFLSCIINPNETIYVKYNFPDENLFLVSIQSLRFIYLADCLSIGKLKSHFSLREKKKIIRQSVKYSRIQWDLSTQG